MSELNSTLRAASSLQRRTFTAFLLGPLVIAVILWLPTPAFALFFTVALLLAAWEWCALAGLRQTPPRVAYLAVMASCMGLFWLRPDWSVWLFGVSLLFWIVQAIRLWRVRRIEPVAGFQSWLLPIGLLVLVAPWAALVDLHRVPELGPGLVLFLMILIWTADSMAYFVGRRWGRAKLAPAVSPGKTRVGVYGAILGAMICGLAFSWIQSLGVPETLLILAVCGLSALLSVVGDLYESLLKRRRGVKDSSHLLPGHGGLLDRIDSLTAAAPFFALGMAWVIT
ncbi:phosphatidate cytidylyltransferase [Thiocystis violascens]|nr:phosphatidate cytidylyltransferase [Thiocystis violascens]